MKIKVIPNDATFEYYNESRFLKLINEDSIKARVVCGDEIVEFIIPMIELMGSIYPRAWKHTHVDTDLVRAYLSNLTEEMEPALALTDRRPWVRAQAQELLKEYADTSI